MPTKPVNATLFSTATLAIYVFLLAALTTSFLPMVRVTVPPMGSVTWSVMDIVRPLIPKMESRKGKATGRPQVDFMDVVREVAPKDAKVGRMSVRFALGILVPVSLALSYGLVILGFFLAPIYRGAAIQGASLFAFLASIYALIGTHYLAKAAHHSFSQALDKASDGIFGIIAQNFVQRISIQPTVGLYALPLFCLLVFGISMYRKGKT